MLVESTAVLGTNDDDCGYDDGEEEGTIVIDNNLDVDDDEVDGGDDEDDDILAVSTAAAESTVADIAVDGLIAVTREVGSISTDSVVVVVMILTV